jgi:phospholipase/carboxylesterase
MLHSELIPAATPGSRRLMVMLHGLGDSIEGFRWLPEAMRLPELNYLLVNAPDEYYGGYSWFDLQGDIVAGVQRSRALLFALLDDLRAQGFPTDQTTLGGFSQGCLMTMEAGLRYPHQFAGLVGISGWVCVTKKVLQELSPVAREQRFLVTHGSLDPVVAIEKTRPQIAALSAAGLKVEWREFRKAHTIAGEEELAVIRDFVRAGYGDVVGA